MRPGRAALLAATGLAGTGRAAHHQFSIYDDLLAFPQFQVAFSDSYILEADAQSKLDYASSTSSARSSSQTSSSDPADNAPSLLTYEPGGESKSHDPGLSDIPQSYEYMKLDTIPYLCSVPQVAEQERNDTVDPVTQADEEKELARARDRGSELIGSMNDRCLYYISGWWSYSLCYNAEVKQYHQLAPGRNGAPPFPPVEDPNVPSYILGQYHGPNDLRAVEGRSDGVDGKDKVPQKATDLVQVQSKGNMKYLVQKLDDGTTCDLTGRPRKIEVQYHCNAQSHDKIGWIKEISTCTYIMVVYTPRLCDDVAFLPPVEHQAHQIVCKEIVAEGAVDEWKAKRAEREKTDAAMQANEAPKQVAGAKKEDSGSQKTATTQQVQQGEPRGTIIGGIELGGMKTVGQPGKRIEPPKAFVAHTEDAMEENVVVVAIYDPQENDGKYQRKSNKELKSMNVDPLVVKEMADEMYDQVRDKKWKVEIAYGPHGTGELRGVVEDEEEGGSEGHTQREEQGEDTKGQQGSDEEYFRDEL